MLLMYLFVMGINRINNSVMEWNRRTNMSDSVNIGGISGDRLRSFVERLERLNEEKTALTADIREVYSEAKGTGYDVKIMRQLIRLRKMDVSDRQEQESMLDVYKRALNMDLPLLKAAE